MYHMKECAASSLGKGPLLRSVPETSRMELSVLPSSAIAAAIAS